MLDRLLSRIKVRRNPRSTTARDSTQQVFDVENDKLFDRRMLVHTAISEQIWREQQLVSTRVTWNLSFQGFMGVVYTFSASNPAGVLIQIVVGLAGFTVSYFCYLGIKAAQLQSGKLKEHWINVFHRPALLEGQECNLSNGAYPQPFSRNAGSSQGRRSSRRVCETLMVMWGVLELITALIHPELLHPLDLVRSAAEATEKQSSGSNSITRLGKSDPLAPKR